MNNPSPYVVYVITRADGSPMEWSDVPGPHHSLGDAVMAFATYQEADTHRGNLPYRIAVNSEILALHCP